MSEGNFFGGGIDVSRAEFSRITAGTIVFGSDAYTNAITVSGYGSTAPFSTTGNLTLETAAGYGSIAVGAPLTVGAGKTLALVTSGAITRSGTSTLTADNLLIEASTAALQSTPDSVGTLAASVGTGAFNFLDTRALTLGPVSATGVSGVTNAPLALAASSLTGGTTIVRTTTGNITLAGNIVASALDLVTPGVFINIGSSTISASDRWRLYASTWVGETRGGLAGSGALPNIYGCTVRRYALRHEPRCRRQHIHLRGAADPFGRHRRQVAGLRRCQSDVHLDAERTRQR